MAVAPILLVGSERSGTTMLRLMMDGHPDVAFLEEFEYAVDQLDDGVPNMDAYEKYLSLHRIFQHSGFEFDSTLSYAELIDSFLEKRRIAKGASMVGATIHYGFENAPQLWPGARYVHIVRDPRDVAQSLVRLRWRPNFVSAAKAWVAGGIRQPTCR